MGKMGIENKNEGFLTSKSEALQQFRVIQGLCGEDGTISFESIAKPNNFLRHRGFKIFLDKGTSKDLFKKDSCFYPRYNNYFKGYTAYESVSYPNKFIRHRGFRLYIEIDDNSNQFKKDASWKTVIPEVQYVSTYENAVFEAKNYPNLKIGVLNNGQGTLTSKYPDRQHFRVVQGLCGVDGTISFESVAKPGNFLSVSNSKLIFVFRYQQNLYYKKAACFYPRYNKYFEGYTAYESVTWPNYFIRHKRFSLWVSPDDNNDLFKNDASWKTKVPEVQQVSTYEDAVFESMNYPDSKMGLNGNGNRGVLTTKQKFQHFRVIPGLCGVAGTISFESVAKPGSFLYIYKDFILLANYAVIEQKKPTCSIRDTTNIL